MVAKRADKRRMDELSVEVGLKEGFKKKLVRHRLLWAVNMENGRPNYWHREIQKYPAISLLVIAWHDRVEASHRLVVGGIHQYMIVIRGANHNIGELR